MAKTTKAAASMSAGKLAYEQRRAAEAGMTLEAWLKRKAPVVEVVAKKPARKGLIGRLLDRAHRPL